MSKRLCCGECGKIVKYYEQVYLDFMNTVIHKRCYKTYYEIVDDGTFEELIDRYYFFNELKRNPNMRVVK